MSTNLHDLGFITEDDTAEIYGIVIPTLPNWRCRGIGPAWHKRGPDVVYHIDDIADHLAR
jgi:hypothetical protein